MNNKITKYILTGVTFTAGSVFTWFFPLATVHPLQKTIGIVSGILTVFSAATVIKKKAVSFIENHFGSWAKEKIVKPLATITILTNENVQEIELEELPDRKEKAEGIVDVLLEEAENNQ